MNKSLSLENGIRILFICMTVFYPEKYFDYSCLNTEQDNVQKSKENKISPAFQCTMHIILYTQYILFVCNKII